MFVYLKELQANVKKVDQNGNPLAGAVFGVWDDPKCEESDKQRLATLTTGANGVSETYQRGKIKKIKQDKKRKKHKKAADY